MEFIETHFHLDYLKDFSPQAVLEKSRAVGVEKLLTISVDPQNLSVVRELAARFEGLYCSQGVHPHDAKKLTPEVLGEIAWHAKECVQCLAIGEIGLDYHYEHSPQKVQRAAFCQQLDIACRLNLPVIIHTREADQDTQSILREFSSKLPRKGVIHSFTGGQGLAEFALSEGFCLGFNGIITFNKADAVRSIVQLTPQDQLLLETDAPFLTPVPHRGKENGPYYLPLIAQKVAEIKDISLAALAAQTTANAQRVFAFDPGEVEDSVEGSETSH